MVIMIAFQAIDLGLIPDHRNVRNTIDDVIEEINNGKSVFGFG